MKRKPGRPKIADKFKRAGMQITLNKSERDRLNDKAAACGMSASAWIRSKMDAEDDGK